MVMAAHPGKRVPENEPDCGSDQSNQCTLRNENSADLRFARSHGHEHGDVPCLFHNHHRERYEDIQCGNEDYQTHGDECDQAL